VLALEVAVEAEQEDENGCGAQEKSTGASQQSAHSTHPSTPILMMMMMTIITTMDE
jgi:hypothetical protein